MPTRTSIVSPRARRYGSGPTDGLRVTGAGAPRRDSRLQIGVIRGGLEMIRKAVPDFQVEVEDLIAEGDRLAAFLTVSGTNEGDYRRARARRRALGSI